MGVTNLWTVLEPAKEELQFEALKGQVLAIDLSLWLCECDATALKVSPEIFPKMHIRNIFYRTIHLLKCGIRPIFVIDGLQAPLLKAVTLSKRLNAPGLKATNRSRLCESVGECCTLFDALGVFYVQSHSEGEALCAYLDKEKIVDGILTNDGDAFLYGAQTVYRDFGVSSKTISRYRMDNIGQSLELSRNDLITVAVLAGCDYNSEGARGIGVSKAIQFAKACREHDLDSIETLRQWLSTSEVSNRLLCFNDAKISKLSQHIVESLVPETFEAIVEEFTRLHESVSQYADYAARIERQKDAQALWRCPRLNDIVQFLTTTLRWSVSHAHEDLYPVLARYRLTEGAYQPSDVQDELPIVKQILGRKKKHGRPCYEVEWSWRDKEEAETFITIEPEGLLENAYSSLTEDFKKAELASKASKKSAKLLEEAASQPKVEDNTDSMDIRVLFQRTAASAQQPFVPAAEPHAAASVDDLIENLLHISLDKKPSSAKSTLPILNKNPFLSSKVPQKATRWKPPPLPSTASEFFGT